jgi:Protein of unknown function DUF115
MTKYLRGNYVVNATLDEPAVDAPDATDAFEKKALARLGGSICFVSKRRPSTTALAASPDVGRRIAGQLRQATFDRIATTSLANADANRAKVGASVLELAALPLGDGDAAVVIAAGPSLHRRRSLERLREARFRGTVVAVDGALGACLRAGVVPHVVVTADPHADRIVRWFGDPTLTAPAADDYFRRQEMDPVHAHDEVAANRALVELVDRHGPRLKVAVATCASPAVVARCQAAGMTLYWWNAALDEMDRPGSLSARLERDNGLPCLNGGGNVGTAAWYLTHHVLRKRRLGLLGMDFSYAPGTEPTKTQYYPELRALLGDRFEEGYIRLESPFDRETWFTDPAYYWFREVFLEMAQETDSETVNCTEGGILHGARVPMVALDDFLARVGRT